MRAPETNSDPAQIALRALAWTLTNAERAARLLAMAGLNPVDLRARAGDAAVLSATLAFLEAHEPDLLACAEAIGETPQAMVTARVALDGGAEMGAGA